MNLEIIINNISNWLQHWIGRRIFRKTRLRHQYKERLNEIVDAFAFAMSDRKRTCSMVSVISEARAEDRSKNIQIDGKLRMAELLGKWYSEFRGSPNFMMLKYISQSFEEFARILYETHLVFNEFFQVTASDEEIRKKLKNDSSCYPYFEKIYNKATADFEELCKEASKNLKNEFREHQFNPLPKL